jgi:hypothetical protein
VKYTAESCLRQVNNYENITIYQFGDGQISVDSKIGTLYANDKIRYSIAGTARPVARKGIRSLEIRKGNKVIDEVLKSDLPASILGDLATQSNNSAAQVLSDTREAMLRVVRANFEKGKWGFSDGIAHFSAEIADEGFKRQLDAH